MIGSPVFSVATRMQTRRGKHVGWKVYINGKKYPRKPIEMYGPVLEDDAIRKAFSEAGLSHDALKDAFALMVMA